MLEEMTELAKQIHALSKGDKQSQLLYLSFLKEVGKIAKVAYKIKPSEQFKQNILNLKNKIETYELR